MKVPGIQRLFVSLSHEEGVFHVLFPFPSPSRLFQSSVIDPFTSCCLIISTQHLLGEGAYSTVYRVKRKSDNCEYALKRVKLDKLSEKEKQNALNEVRILASCRHPNLIAYKEAFIEESTNSLW